MCSMIFSPVLILNPKFFILNFHSNQIIKIYYIFRFQNFLKLIFILLSYLTL